MHKIKFILIFVVFAKNILGQSYSERLKPNFQQADVYNNFKDYPHIRPYTTIFIVDSSGNMVLETHPNGQKLCYLQVADKADSLYKNNQFSQAVNLYIIAFKINNDRGEVKHRYNTACCYAKLNEHDSAFFHLFRIAEKGNYYNYIEIQKEKYLEPLQKDSRWAILIKLIKSNAVKMEETFDSQIPIKN